MKRGHKVAIGTYGTFTIIFMVVITIILNGVIIKQSVENRELKTQIENLKTETNAKITELAIAQINNNLGIKNDLNTISDDLSETNKEIGQLKIKTTGDFSKVVEDSLKSIVIIRTLSSQGSGFFVNNEGYIITNAHVLNSQNGEYSKLIQIITSNNEIYEANAIGFIEKIDLALLKIEKKTIPLEFGNSDLTEVGEKVIAIGTPQGLSFTTTDGIISATKRIGLNNEPIYIQTNAQLNPGNSGGPLLNKEGKVIGINNFKLEATEGIGFALESNKAKEGINLIGRELLNITIVK